MPSFMKDEMKKKDEEKLEEMKREIDEAEAAEAGGESDAEKAFEPGEAETAEGNPEDVEEAEAAEEAEGGELSGRVQQLENELQEKDAQMLRLRADFDNFRRRSQKEREELGDVVIQGIITDLLPLLDNFERALSAEVPDLDSFRTGVSMIYKQMQELLVKNGLEPIETEGRKFDPNFHQAVMRVQDPEKEDDMIEQELQRGYMVKGRVVRPSMVQVVSN